MTAFAALGIFEPHTIPDVGPEALVFPARTRAEGPADLFILEDHKLRIYSADGGPARTVHLPQGASAFDVGAAHDDRDRDLIVVHGDKILQYSMSDESASPVELFTMETIFSPPAAQPHPYVLTTTMDDRTLLALPTDDALELRRFNGELEARFPLTNQAHPSFGPSFSAWPVEPVQTAPAGGFEMRVSHVYEKTVELPETMKHQPRQERPYRRVTPSQMTQIADLGPESWPWFPLRADGDDSIRVLYAPAQPDLSDTLIRLRHAPTDEDDQTGVTLLPARRYPGRLMDPSMDMPDFNGNGYVDLLLWSAPKPTSSIDSIVRTLIGRTWPIRITVHHYDPIRERHEPTPSAIITCRLPVLWMMIHEDGTPLRNVVLQDFTGDGRTDCAWSCDEHTFQVWRSRETGFSDRPDRTYEFPEPGMRIEQRVDFDGLGRTSLVFRGETTVLWLYAKPDETGQ